jgi:putative flippase GtrA
MMDDRYRFLRFLALGGIAAGCNWLSRFGWSLILPFEVAVVTAYATGMVVAFLLFRRFVFPASPLPVRIQVRNFVLVNMVGISLTWIVATALVRVIFPMLGFTFHAEAIGHAIAIAAPTAASWVGHKRFTFAQKAD